MVEIISRLLNDDDKDVTVIGAYNVERKSLIVTCKGTSKLNGEDVYFLDSWIFEVWSGCYPEVNQFVIKDKKSGKNHLLPFERLKGKVIRNASSKPGKEWAIRLSDILPQENDLDFTG